MTNVALTLNGKEYHIPIPTEWNEFTLRELTIVSSCILQNKPVQLLTLLLISERIKQNKLSVPINWYRMVPATMLHRELMPWADALLKNNNLTVQPYPIRKGYFAPDSDFNDLTCGEYEECTALVRQYHADNDMGHILKLFSVLYRKKDASNRRIPLHLSIVPNLSSSFYRNISIEIFHIVYLWYLGCLNALHITFAALYEGADEKEEEEDLMSFTKLIHAGAGERNGTREQIRAMPIKEYLYDCLLAKQESERLIEKQKNERQQLH